MPALTRINDQTPDPATYKAVNAADIFTTAIFPPVGIARLGDSTKEFFVGPEAPKINVNPEWYQPVKSFRDSDQHIRRQAARFRVYAYKNDGTVLGELNEKNGYRLTWTVHVRNTKAEAVVSLGGTPQKRNPSVPANQRKGLIVDPGAQTIVSNAGVNAFTPLDGSFTIPGKATIPVNLGQLQVDDAGHLLFIAGPGKSSSTPDATQDLSFFTNDEWVDDVCDGTVSVEIKNITTGSTVNFPSKHGAAISSGPPKYAWSVNSFASLFDIIEDAYQPSGDVGTPEFYTHIYPVLIAPSAMAWTSASASNGHSGSKPGNFAKQANLDKLLSTAPGDQQRKRDIFDRLKNPNGGGDGDMPKLSGQEAHLTKLQYNRFTKWQDNTFTVANPARYRILEDAPLNDQPMLVTRANLEPTIGGSFYPGIDQSRITINPDGNLDIYRRDITTLKPPFRINYDKIQPGQLTEGLAEPWQADYSACGESWWPAGRPITVKDNVGSTSLAWDRNVGSGRRMVDYWKNLGFVLAQPAVPPNVNDPAHIESERVPIPDPPANVQLFIDRDEKQKSLVELLRG
jgi:hypothetical protein